MISSKSGASPVVACLVLSSAACGALALAQGASTIDVDAIRPGMKGHGLTVFRGTEPKRFDVEVIDVLRNFRPDQDLILVKTPHPILDRAIAVGGMSGSPIYFDGKLAGAYAYGWTFGRDPVIGVTPIKNMLAELKRPVRRNSFPGARPLRKPASRSKGQRRQPKAGGARHESAGLPPFRGENLVAWDVLRAFGARSGRSFSKGRADRRALRPTVARTPVMLGGFTDEIAELLGKELAPLGLTPLQAGGGRTRSDSSSARFVAGGALGVQLIRGDISATAVGTVTHVAPRGRLVAFGHPMTNAGEIGLPTATARVLHIFASTARSFKIAEVTHPLGTMIHDRQSAIVVDPNLEPATVPVRIKIHGVRGAPRTEWNLEVASHRALTPVLVFSALANAVKATAAERTDVVYRARTSAKIFGYGAVSLEDEGFMAAGPSDARELGRLRLFSLIDAAFANPFEESRVTSVNIELDLRFAREWAQIIDASVTSEEVDPGSTVPVHVVLRQFGQPDSVRVLPVLIPEHAAGNTIELKVTAARDVAIEHPHPRSLRDMVRNIEERYPATSLAVELKMPTRGMRFMGHVVRSLPASALSALQLRNAAGSGQPFATYERRTWPLSRVVSGSAKLSLNVREAPKP